MQDWIAPSAGRPSVSLIYNKIIDCITKPISIKTIWNRELSDLNLSVDWERVWSNLSITFKNLAHRLIHFKVIHRQLDWLVNPGLCLLNDDSGLCISSMQKRMLFAGFTAAKKTIIQNWFTPHMCGKTYWIHSLLKIVTYECTTAQINGAKPLTIDAWQCFLFDIRDCVKE